MGGSASRRRQASGHGQEEAEVQLVDRVAIASEQEKVSAMSPGEMRAYLARCGVAVGGSEADHELRELALAAAEKAVMALTGKKIVKRPGPPKGEFCLCWDMFLPEVAPEWYVRRIGGLLGADCHSRPAPEGSLFLLGHVELDVPKARDVRAVYENGLGFKLSPKSEGSELRMNAGPSQVRLTVAPDNEASRWPGEMRIWVNNIQETYDLMGGVDGALDTHLVADYEEGINGGEFSMKVADPFLKYFFIMTEAPKGFAPRIWELGCEGVAVKSNVVAISDLMIKTRSRADTQLLGFFYREFFGAAISVLQYSTMVHFSPATALHQTVTFKEDPTVPSATNLGVLCFYLRDVPSFRRAYVRCHKAGIVESPASLKEAEASHEFVITGMVDPATGRVLLPMRNRVRCADGHPECVLAAAAAGA